MIKLRKYWWIFGLLFVSITMSGCVVQFNLGVPGAPLINTIQPTPVPTVTSTPVPTVTPVASPKVSYINLADMSENSSSAPSNATVSPLPSNETNATVAVALSMEANNSTTGMLMRNMTEVSNETTVMPVVQPSSGVKLIPPEGAVVPGSPEFWQIKNTGDASNTFVVKSVPEGMAKILPARITLQPGETHYFTVFPQSRTSNTTITAASSTDPTIHDSISIEL